MHNDNLVEKENKEIVKAYRNLLRFLAHKTLREKKLIRDAFELALEAHKNVRRKSGEPYILHPLAVAQICVEEIGLGTTSVICALLHDTVEDTDITLDFIERKFGPTVARIIDGLTKISGVFDQPDRSMQAENFKKMLLTLSDDVRVIIIKLADRLHNMRTLDHMSTKSQLKIASETSYVYAPLAHRLGLYVIKTELEDLSIKYLEPESYNYIKNKLQETKAQRTRYINSFVEPIIHDLNGADITYEIKGRPKSIHSIMTKMKKQNVAFEEVYDLFAIRIIVDTEFENEKSDCWKVYSMVTDHYTPNPDRLRDWVSTPRANGYESLHTTVMGPKGRWVEVQIRSRRMDEIAEKGYAAHWKYKDSTQNVDNGLEQWLSRVREIMENPDSNALEFLDDFKLTLYSEEIFVFTPRGDLKKLPANATVLDFAFEIHSNLGLQCIGAKMNNKLVPINQKLTNGDQVEILTSAKQKPTEEWLKIANTAKAKAKIRDFFKQEKLKVAHLGKEILERKLKNAKVPFTSELLQSFTRYYKLNNVSELYYQLATGKIDRTRIDLNEILHQEKTKTNENVKPVKIVKHNNEAVVIGDSDVEMNYSFAKCCNPIPGDEIFGFITIGEGVKIHRTNCQNATVLMSNYGYRVIKAKWAGEMGEQGMAFKTTIRVEGIDSVGIVSTITDIISKQLQINMKSISIESDEGRFHGIITLEVSDTKHLEELMNKIEMASPVITVRREDLN